MSAANIVTVADRFLKFFNTAPAPASVTVAPTATIPLQPKNTGGSDGVFALATTSQQRGNYGLFCFFGTGGANKTFDAVLTGWSRTAGGLWIPMPLAKLYCTTGSTTGAAGTDVAATDYFATTVAVSGSIVVPNYSLIPSANGIQFIALDLMGAEQIQLQILTPDGGSAATAANGLMRTY